MQQLVPIVRTTSTLVNVTFDDVTIEILESLKTEELDALEFGVVKMTPNGIISAYNRAEADFSGLTPSRIVGRHFFTAVAPCTNNALVAGRFEHHVNLDEIINYVFTLRMVCAPVRLRLLKKGDVPNMYLLIERWRRNES